jgi:uncharacterized protein YndB with AHSA1/START domain
MTDVSEDVRTVTVEREFAHPPEKLWRALSEPHLIGEWLMKTDFAPEVGRAFTLTGDWGSVACAVRAVEPGECLSYAWSAMGVDTVVTFTLTPTATGTRLRVEQTGFRPGQGQAFAGAKYGWANFFDALGGVLAGLA